MATAGHQTIRCSAVHSPRPHKGHAPYADGLRKSGSPAGTHHRGGWGRPPGNSIPRACAGPAAAERPRLPSGRQFRHHARPASPGAG
eukprot:14817784-Alexandrium_andersonii.AAC.1